MNALPDTENRGVICVAKKLYPNNMILQEVISLLKQTGEPLKSDEIARKLNRNTHEILHVLLDHSYNKVIEIIVNKKTGDAIGQPAYKYKI